MSSRLLLTKLKNSNLLDEDSNCCSDDFNPDLEEVEVKVVSPLLIKNKKIEGAEEI